MTICKWQFFAVGVLVNAFITGCVSNVEKQRTPDAYHAVAGAEPKREKQQNPPTNHNEFVRLEIEREKPGWCKVTVKNTGLRSAIILTPQPYTSTMPPFCHYAEFQVRTNGRTELLVGKGVKQYTFLIFHSHLPPDVSKWPRVKIPSKGEHVYRFSTEELLRGASAFFGGIPPDCETIITAQINLIASEDSESIQSVLKGSIANPFKDW